MKTQTRRKPAPANRSAITGRFVKNSTVRRHPKTTVKQSVSRRSKKSGS